MLRTIFLLVFICVLTGCRKEKDPTVPDQPPTGMNEPGFGPSTAAFKDAAWKLPSGISLQNNIHWFEYCSSDTNWTKKKNYMGIPNPQMPFFLVCLNFQNHTNSEIVIPLPPIICIRSRFIQTQNGIILVSGDRQIKVPAQSNKRIFSPVYCLNKNRTAPFAMTDDEGRLHEWLPGPEKVPAPLQEIVDILAPKNISYEKILHADGISEDPVKVMKLMIVQDAIWEVTDGPGLSPMTRQKLKDLSL